MKRNLYGAIAAAALLAACGIVWAAATPALKTGDLGGRGHYYATLASSAVANVSDGTTVVATGTTAMDFLIIGAGGSVTVTPQAGYEIGGEVVWVDLNPIADPAATGEAAHYDLAPDLVRVKAEGCSGCVFSVYWIGYVR